MILRDLFESFVNLEGCKTKVRHLQTPDSFESFVNLEGCKTITLFANMQH